MDDQLRLETETAAEMLHVQFGSRQTPPAEYVRNKCRECSLFDVCLPRQAAPSRNVNAYLARMTSTDAPTPFAGESEGEGK